MSNNFEGTNSQFKEGYLVGLSIAFSFLENNRGLLNESFDDIMLPYVKEGKSEDFIYGLKTAVSTVSNEISKRIYGPRESITRTRRM